MKSAVLFLHVTTKLGEIGGESRQCDILRYGWGDLIKNMALRTLVHHGMLQL